MFGAEQRRPGVLDRPTPLVRVIPLALLASLYVSAVGALAAAVVSAGLVITVGPVFVLGALPPLLSDRAAKMLGPRARVLAALMLIACTPLIATRALVQLQTFDLLRIDYLDTSSSGSFWLGVTVLAVPVGAPLMVLAWSQRSRLLGDALGRNVYRCAIALGAALAVTAVALHASRPLPEHWRTSLPIRARLTATSFDEVPDDARYARDDHRLFRADTELGSLSVRTDLPHRYSESGAWFRAAGGVATVPLPFMRAEGDWLLRYDARARITVIETPGSEWFAAIDERGVPIRVFASRVPVAPPIVWTLTAIVGVVAAVFIRHAGIRLRAQLAARALFAGRVVEDSIAVLDDGTRIFAPGLPPGASIVACGIEPVTTTFRNAPAFADEIVAGTLDELRDDARAIETAHAMWAAGLAALSTSPIAVLLLC